MIMICKRDTREYTAEFVYFVLMMIDRSTGCVDSPDSSNYPYSFTINSRQDSRKASFLIPQSQRGSIPSEHEFYCSKNSFRRLESNPNATSNMLIELRERVVVGCSVFRSQAQATLIRYFVSPVLVSIELQLPSILPHNLMCRTNITHACDPYLQRVWCLSCLSK